MPRFAHHRASRHATSPYARRLTRATVRLAIGVLVGLTGLPSLNAAPAEPTADDRLWTTVNDPVPPVHEGHRPELILERFRPVVLNHGGMAQLLAQAPLESAASGKPVELSLPAPGGGSQLFSIEESPVMEPGLAVRHPEITTYAGEGITDPTATIRISSTPLGFQASIRGAGGPWFIDPYYHRDHSLYASYFARDLHNSHAPLVEPNLEELDSARAGEGTGGATSANADALLDVGEQLRTYRLALTSDPGYANYHGAANVTAAKVALVNRVTHIYEDETAIRLILVANNDNLNLNTAAAFAGANGPCGSAPCFTTAAPTCSSSLLNRNRIVIGQLIGAGNYDIGHIGLGANGGGVAGLAVVGGDGKARGCTGVNPPTGDFFAVDYVAHEMGHQFAGNHTFSGVNGSCAGNASAVTTVEPGSGSSIMAYAGICDIDDLQAHSDPYWSQRSFQEITTFVTSSRSPIDEVQTASFRDFDGADSFTLTYQGSTTPAITNGVNYNAAGISAALATILPAGATTTVANFGGGGAPSAQGFQVTFGGSLDSVNVSALSLNPTGFTGYFGETAKGGPVDNQGWQITATGNSAPVVTAPASYTIPYRTPFALTGSATDPDGDALTYMWEQNNPGAGALFNPAKAVGPLFRQFGVGQDASVYDPQAYNSPGENHPTDDPTRVFPDMEQILANNTNAELGVCPAPTDVDCHSEFLPTSTYPGPMHFRFTVRDHRPGGAGVSTADTVVNLAPGTGPFRILAPNTATTFRGGSTQPVVWSMAGTVAPPINATNVEILLSTDGGASFPHVLATSTLNDGVELVTIPNVETGQGRIMVRPVGNVFFDVSNEDMTIEPGPEADLEVVSLTAEGAPQELLVGETATVSLREVITNHGPTSPVDARVDRTAVASGSGSVDPTTATHHEAAVGLGEHRTASQAYGVSCTDPGAATFTFGATVSPTSGELDPNPDNDSATATFEVDCVVPVTINIKPGNAANQLSLKSGGSAPVAVLSTLPGEYGNPVAFNATTINAASVRFGPESVVSSGGGSPEEHGQGHIEDSFERDERTRDGDLDMLLHFAVKRSEFSGTETTACVRGTYGPTDIPFIGCDSVKLSK